MPTPPWPVEVQFASEGQIAFLTFNRPDARNAMTWPMYDALAAACDRVDADERIRVFVLPALNLPDLEELPEEVKREMRFVPAQTLDDVLKEALPTPVPAT